MLALFEYFWPPEDPWPPNNIPKKPTVRLISGGQATSVKVTGGTQASSGKVGN